MSDEIRGKKRKTKKSVTKKSTTKKSTTKKSTTKKSTTRRTKPRCRNEKNDIFGDNFVGDAIRTIEKKFDHYVTRPIKRVVR